MIVGINTLTYFGTLHVVGAMKPSTSLAQESNMRVEAFGTEYMCVPLSTGTFARGHIELIRTWGGTKLIIYILDADYKTPIYQRLTWILTNIYPQ